MKDYYKILQVAPDASTEVIQMAYKALAKKYHPDLNPGQEEAAQEKMKDVNEAYEILSDKDKRWQYDQIYYRQEKTEQKTSYSAPEPPKGAQTHSAQSKGEQTSAAPVDSTPEDEAPDEELIYSNLATASLLASDKISLEELFALDDSDTSANTTQTETAENSNTAASIQSDAIPPEVSGCEKDGTWQKILVEATGSNATLTLWTYRDGQWEKDLSTTAAIGAKGLTTDKTEGDHMTPEGTFPICFAFSTKEKNTMLYSKIIKEDSVWVCDPESIYYNTLQSKNDPYKDWADKGGAENMYPKFSKGSSNACICFGFNGDGLSAYSATPYAGSALFIDGVGENGNMNSGYGDIKISGKDMTKLLSYLCANDNPVITIKSAQ